MWSILSITFRFLPSDSIYQSQLAFTCVSNRPHLFPERPEAENRGTHSLLVCVSLSVQKEAQELCHTCHDLGGCGTTVYWNGWRDFLSAGHFSRLWLPDRLRPKERPWKMPLLGMLRNIAPLFSLVHFHIALYSSVPNRLGNVTRLQQLLVWVGIAPNDHWPKRKKHEEEEYQAHWLARTENLPSLVGWLVRLRSHCKWTAPGFTCNWTKTPSRPKFTYLVLSRVQTTVLTTPNERTIHGSRPGFV